MKTIMFVFGILLLLLVPIVSQAEIPAGEYGVMIEGAAFPGKVILTDHSFFSYGMGEGWCLVDENGTPYLFDNSPVCGPHYFNSTQDIFIAGQISFTVPGHIELIAPVIPDPCANGFSPSEGCQ